jgi:hypothetical protein
MAAMQTDGKAEVWHCDNCNSWWGYGGSLEEGSGALNEIVANREECEWDSYRGWSRANEPADACPECGSTDDIHVLFTMDIPGE